MSADRPEWGSMGVQTGSPTNDAVVSITRSPTSELWIATRQGRIFRGDGVTWTRVAWSSVELTSIAATPSGAIVVRGGSTAILRKN